MNSALILIDKKTSRVIHVIIEKLENLQKYIMKDDPKLNYTIIPDWDIVKEAVKHLAQK